MQREYETVIGLEVHVELLTKTKLFCGCSAAFGGAANTRTCPVCTGMPGTLPVLNRRVVELACLVGLATGCTVTQNGRFDRKNYFYPDNPQNYQITQLYFPICRNGAVEIETAAGKKTVHIHEIHIEEDAGKLLHDEASGVSHIDFNRAGVPLLEIVSEPDFRSAEEVVAYLEELRVLLQYVKASDGKLNEGSMRADVNLSVRQAGEETLGTRTEMKNLNSFRAITHAIAAEADRQIALLSAGERVVQETRRWDEDKACSYSMRSKEDAVDYRYFPEPDLPPLTVDAAWLADLRNELPELRAAKRERYVKEYALPEYDVKVLTESKRMTEVFEATVRLCGKPKRVSNFLMGEALRLLHEEQKDTESLSLSPEKLAKLIGIVDEGKISQTTAKEAFAALYRDDTDPGEYCEAHGLTTLRDEDALRDIILRVIAENPKPVGEYRSGKEKVLGFLVGQTMKATRGRAEPALTERLLKELL